MNLNKPGAAPEQAASTLPDDASFRDAQEFSLVLGGPLFQLLRRTHLADDGLHLMRQRVISIALLAWLPLLLLSAFEGRMAGGTVPFLHDVEVHVRFLLALPLLIGAEMVVHQRLGPIVQAFLARNLIPGEARQHFDEALRAAFRLRNSVSAELLLIVLVYALGVLVIWRQYIALDVASWYITPAAEGSHLSLAGIWYGYVSLPIFQFILIRWYFRLFIWARFLWQVSRIPLQLLPTHPDRVGGLGFLANTVYAFAILVAAHGTLLAGQIASRIFFAGASLPQYKAEVGLIVAFLLCVVFGPLLVFTPQLLQAKRQGLREYGGLAERYVREFDRKWLRGGAPEDEPLVGSGDIQSLADLGNSYEVVRSMRPAPITRDALLHLAAAALAPLLPLLLTMMSLEELLKNLFGILF